MYDEEYAKSNNVKAWDSDKPIKYFLLVLLVIILGGFISVFIAAISPFAFISGLIMVLWLSSWVLLPIWLAIKWPFTKMFSKQPLYMMMVYGGISSLFI